MLADARLGWGVGSFSFALGGGWGGGGRERVASFALFVCLFICLVELVRFGLASFGIGCILVDFRRLAGCLNPLLCSLFAFHV